MNRAYTLMRCIAVLLGALEGLFGARLLLKLLAARLDNPVFSALFAVTQPFVTLLALLDARQPRFGAVLECSTLAWMLLLALVMIALRFIVARNNATRATHGTFNLEKRPSEYL